MAENQEGVLKPFGNAASLPDAHVPVKTYDEYRRFVRSWAEGRMGSTLIVIGAAGIGKTESALAALKTAQDKYEGRDNNPAEDFLYLKGKSTQYGLYSQLFAHKDRLVLLDDLDELLADASVTGLLKMLLETAAVKRIQWTSAKTLKEDSYLPADFETTSKTLMLVNELKQVSRNFQAVLDRAMIIWFCPSVDEVAKYVASWFDMRADRDVYDYVTERLPLATEPSCRYYFKAAQFKRAGLNWQDVVERMVRPNDERAAIVRELQEDKSLKTERAREAAWTARTGKSRQAYYAVKKALGIKGGKVGKNSRQISEGLKRKHAERKAKRK
jgi:transposase